MLIYPAIDLIDGQCVRLSQGAFDRRRNYPMRPGDALKSFAAAGAEWAHVVDLEGARAGRPVQHALLSQLAQEAPLKVQVAGGFKDRDAVAAALDGGAARVVIGSLCVRDPRLVASIIDEFGPDAIVIALDVRRTATEPVVAISGWAKDSGVTLWDAAALIPDARHLLVTDISRDGMLGGPNTSLIATCCERLGDMAVQASGGVAGPGDLDALEKAGAHAAIVGKAIWEGRLDLAEAVARARV